jgi:hypothetical protein
MCFAWLKNGLIDKAGWPAFSDGFELPGGPLFAVFEGWVIFVSGSNLGFLGTDS